MEKQEELLIRLEEKTDHITEQLKILPELDKRLRTVETSLASYESLKKDVCDLEKKSENWGILNSIGVFVAAAVGIFVSK